MKTLISLLLPALLLCGCGDEDPEDTSTAEDTASTDSATEDTGSTDTSSSEETVIASGDWLVGPLAHDDTHVYFVDGSSGDVSTFEIVRAPLAGGAMETVHVPGAQVTWMAVVGDELFFARDTTPDSALWTVPVAGGSAAELGALALYTQDHFAHDDEAAYAVMAGNGLTRFEPGGGSTVLGVLTYNAPFVSDGEHIYLSNAETNHDGPLERIPVTGGSPETLADPAGITTSQLRVGDDHLYWSGNADPTAGSATFARMPKAGGEVTRLTETFANPGYGAFVLGAAHLYWSQDGTVHRLPLDGGAPEPFATTDGYELLFADGYLYYFDAERSLVRKGE